MRLRVSTVLLIGLVLAIAGAVFPSEYHRWFATRSFEPVNMPVTLAPGRLTTGDFDINFRGTYYVELNVAADRDDCSRYGPASVLHTHIKILRDGKVVDEGNGSTNWYIAIFDAEKFGAYRIDVEVQTDASCLQAGHPRLRVWTSPDNIYSDLDEFRGWLRLLLFTGAIGALGVYIRSKLRDSRSRKDEGTVFEQYGPQYPRRTSRFRDAPRISMLPGFGLYAGTVIGFVAIVMMIFQLAFTPISKGLPVQASQSVPAIAGGAIVVRVESAGDGELTSYGKIRLFVNGKQVTREQLPDALVAELKLRGDWVVYIQGDDQLQWQTVADLVDAAKGVHARVALVTMRTSAGFKSTAGAAVPHKR